MKKLLPVTAALFAAASLSLPAQALTLVQWDFETPFADLSNATASPAVAASTGSGTASGYHASAATDWTTPAGNGSANAMSSNTWAVGDYYQFSFATTGHADMLLSFDQTGSGTGPRSFALAYSTDGVSFSTFGSYVVLVNGSPNPAWSASSVSSVHSFSFDLSAVSALDNQGLVVIRLVDTATTSINGGVVGTGGTSRIDNVTVAMAPVPEPASYALLLGGLAAIGLLARRRSSR